MKNLLENLLINCNGDLCENIGFGIVAIFSFAVIWHSLSII
jgi:hypothetical protein